MSACCVLFDAYCGTFCWLLLGLCGVQAPTGPARPTFLSALQQAFHWLLMDVGKVCLWIVIATDRLILRYCVTIHAGIVWGFGNPRHTPRLERMSLWTCGLAGPSQTGVLRNVETSLGRSSFHIACLISSLALILARGKVCPAAIQL